LGPWAPKLFLGPWAPPWGPWGASRPMGLKDPGPGAQGLKADGPQGPGASRPMGPMGGPMGGAQTLVRFFLFLGPMGPLRGPRGPPKIEFYRFFQKMVKVRYKMIKNRSK